MNIILIGMSGSGKSTFGAFISQLMNMPLIDTDAEICKNYGDINTIFSSGGESVFRAFEEEQMLLASKKDNCVIALGGGAVLNQKAIKALKSNGLVVYLYCDAEFLFERLKGDNTRPLLSGEDMLEKIQKMLLARGNLYLESADIVLNQSGILQSRNLLESDMQTQLGALYYEFINSFEKKVYAKFN